MAAPTFFKRRKLNFLWLLVCMLSLFVVWRYCKDNLTDDEVISPTVLLAHRGLPKSKMSGKSDSLEQKELEFLRTQKMLPFGVHALLKPGRRGLLNVHSWDELCGEDLRTLLNFPLFPNVPSSRKLHPSLKITGLAKNYGKRIFGYIVAPETANYTFRLLASGSAEFWLSSDSKPENCKIIVGTDSRLRTSSITSHSQGEIIKLEKSVRYFFDIAHKHGNRKHTDFLNVQWRTGENSADNFHDISPSFLKGFQDDLEILDSTVNLESFLGQYKYVPSSFTKIKKSVQEQLPRFPFIDKEIVQDLFPKCEYTPNYLVRRKLWRYGSKWENVYSSVFPSDGSNRTQENGAVIFGNDIIDEGEARDIAMKVLRQIERKINRKLLLQTIVNMEKKHSRYLVELLLKDTKTQIMVRFSEYVYLMKGNDEICYPENFTLNKASVVNLLVVSGRNQGKWVYHFINNIERIYKETNDSNFNVIIVDFLSPNVDLKAALERSSLPHYMLLGNAGPFWKSLAIQQGVNRVVDSDEIILVLDLHLDVPSSFIEDVRKHTIKGRQAFLPVIERFECGYGPGHKKGSYWEFHGYGIVGVYKRDWDNFGGMNINEFKSRWGGEDIEMADRILQAGLEIERRKVVGLSHYFHSKKGMWNNN